MKNHHDSRFGRAAIWLPAGMLLLMHTLPATAHTHPTSMTPAADSTVAPPAQVCVHFDDPLEPAFSHLNVFDAQGQQVNTEKSATQDKAHTQLCVALPHLAAGPYQVKWEVVGHDGHRMQGHYSYTVR